MKVGLYITITIFTAVFFQWYLYYVAPKPDGDARPFNRLIKNGVLIKSRMVDNGFGARDILGWDKGKLVFSGSAPGIIQYWDSSLKLIQIDTIRSIYNKHLLQGNNTWMDSSLISVANGNQKISYTIDLADGRIKDSLSTTFIFTRVTKISNTSYIFRYFDNSGTKDQLFLKQTTGNKAETLYEKGISERNGDAGIGTDGILSFNSAKSTLTYTHFYLGVILFIDTNLNVIKRSPTIDSTTLNRMRTSKTNELTITNATPRYYNSYYSFNSDSLLYVCSAIKAKNETKEVFDNNTAIDVYSVPGGDYKYSFYIPKIDGKRFTSLKIVRDNMLIVVYPTTIIKFII